MHKIQNIFGLMFISCHKSVFPVDNVPKARVEYQPVYIHLQLQYTAYYTLHQILQLEQLNDELFSGVLCIQSFSPNSTKAI